LAKIRIIAQRARLDKALELKLRGLSDIEIAARMKEDGYEYCSPRTINRILHEVPEERVLEELKRQQLRDITTADVPLRLKWRAHILDKMMPQKIEAKTEGKQTIVVKMWKPDAETGDSDKVLPT